MRITVLGGTGHIGSFLVPRLVVAGHEVTVVTRAERQPYRDRAEWRDVRRITADRTVAEDDGTWVATVLATKPDVVVDLICFTEASARLLVEGIGGAVGHLLHCGSIAAYGPSLFVPTHEDMPKRPTTPYGVQKAAVEAVLLRQSRDGGVPATVIHPGHIVGPGWVPINPQGNGSLTVYETIARGKPLTVPNLGFETLHHVHADDVARLFEAAIAAPQKAAGESFNAVSPFAMTFRGYATALYEWYGRAPNLVFVPWETLRTTMTEADATSTWSYHLSHSPHAGSVKAERRLGFRPSITSIDAVTEALTWLIDAGRLPPRT